MSGYEALCHLYPELEHHTKVGKDKIRNRNSKVSTIVKLRKQNWEQLKKLWLQLAKRQMIKFDPSVNQDAESVARNVFNDSDNKIFVLQIPQIIHQELSTDNNVASVRETKSDNNTKYLTMNYGKFLKILAKQTDLPVNLLNNLMIQAIKRLRNNTNYINEKTLGNLIQAFNSQFNERIKTSYSLNPLNSPHQHQFTMLRSKNLWTLYRLMFWACINRIPLQIQLIYMIDHHCVMTV